MNQNTKTTLLTAGVVLCAAIVTVLIVSKNGSTQVTDEHKIKGVERVMAEVPTVIGNYGFLEERWVRAIIPEGWENGPTREVDNELGYGLVNTKSTVNGRDTIGVTIFREEWFEGDPFLEEDPQMRPWTLEDVFADSFEGVAGSVRDNECRTRHNLSEQCARYTVEANQEEGIKGGVYNVEAGQLPTGDFFRIITQAIDGSLDYEGSEVVQGIIDSLEFNIVLEPVEVDQLQGGFSCNERNVIITAKNIEGWQMLELNEGVYELRDQQSRTGRNNLYVTLHCYQDGNGEASRSKLTRSFQEGVSGSLGDSCTLNYERSEDCVYYNSIEESEIYKGLTELFVEGGELQEDIFFNIRTGIIGRSQDAVEDGREREEMLESIEFTLE